MTKAVEVEELVVSINDKELVKDVSLELEVGSLLALTGPTGSGKSTLLKTIAGIIPGLYSSFRVSGNIRVYGLEPHEAREEGLVTYVPQDPTAYFIGTTVADEVGFITGFEGYELIKDFVGDPSRRIHELSDGQLYRLLLATSLIAGVKLLLIDEPTSHVDPWTLTEFLEALRNYCREHGASAIIVDHRVELLRGYVDRVIQLKPLVKRDAGRLRGRRGQEFGKGRVAGVNGYAVIADGLRFSYGDGKEVLKGVSLKVMSGDSLIIVGRNGAGKSTLVRVLAGLLRPREGVLRVAKPVFLVPQAPIYWFSQDTVRGEVELYARVWGFDNDISDVLEAFHLGELGNRNPLTLSIGEARRLSLALAYVSRAKVLLLDEPTLGLDRPSRELFIEVLKEFTRKGVTVIVAAHDLELIKHFGRAYVLENGYLRVLNDGLEIAA